MNNSKNKPVRFHDLEITERGFVTYEPEYLMTEAESAAARARLLATSAVESLGDRRPLLWFSAPGRTTDGGGTATLMALDSDREDRTRREMLGVLLGGAIIVAVVMLAKIASS